MQEAASECDSEERNVKSMDYTVADYLKSICENTNRIAMALESIAKHMDDDAKAKERGRKADEKQEPFDFNELARKSNV